MQTWRRKKTSIKTNQITFFLKSEALKTKFENSNPLNRSPVLFYYNMEYTDAASHLRHLE